MIEFKNVSKRFDDLLIVNNLSLSIADGEFVAFMGPSGCGKTTILHMIGGIEPVSSGEIIIDGENMNNRRVRERLMKHSIGFLFQNFALVDKKTVRENINLVPKECRSGIALSEALAFVNLNEKIDTKVYKLSGGEQQRVALARLLFKRCNIILADEPTGSLDEKNAETVMNLLMKLNRMGKTIIMVTHNESHRRFASRVIDLSLIEEKV